MLEDAWPLFGLVVRTARLTLRLPREGELAALGGWPQPGYTSRTSGRS